jgi:hypothetical protein
MNMLSTLSVDTKLAAWPAPSKGKCILQFQEEASQCQQVETKQNYRTPLLILASFQLLSVYIV